MPIVNSTKVAEYKEEITFTYEPEKVVSTMDDIAREIGKHNTIKGFRPGKAPLNSIKLFARKQILEIAKQKLLSEAFQDILNENKWKPFTTPQIVDIETTFNSFNTKLIVGYIPNVELTAYKGLELKEPENLPNLDAIYGKFIDSVCNNHATQRAFEEDDFVLMGDTVIVDYESTIDGQPFDQNKASGVMIEIGQNKTLGGFEDNLVGMRVGESREFEITFDDKISFKPIANKTVKFNVKLNMASRKEPHPFDDELAKKMNAENLDKLKELLMQRAEEYRKEMMFNVLKTSACDKLNELNDIHIPDWMTSTVAEDTVKMQSKNFAELSADEKDALYKESAKNIKLSFIIEKIKDLEIDTVLSDQELMKILDANINKLPENMRKELIEGKNMALYSKLLNDIQTDYVIKWVVDNAKIVKENENEQNQVQ